MPTLRVCRACAERIGALAAAQHTRVWSSQTRPLETKETHAAAEHAQVERDFEEFKAGIAKQIAVDDFEAHLDLAEAYREMGLFEDARREAGHVLTSAATRVLPLATKMTELALRLVLTPPLLEPRGLHDLKLLLHRVS